MPRLNPFDTCPICGGRKTYDAAVCRACRYPPHPQMWTGPEPKLCECGCGLPAPLVRSTNRNKGVYRGQPRRFRKGHMRGPLTPGWKGNAALDTTKRSRGRKFFELGPCERCGEPATDRHHRDGDTGHNTQDNIAILCRRCHMLEDGRLARLAALPRPTKPPRSCRICGEQPRRQSFWFGRCHRCHEYFRRNGIDRPAVSDVRADRARAMREASCLNCGRRCGDLKGAPVRGLCASCYNVLRRTGQLAGAA